MMGDRYAKARMRALVRDAFQCQHPDGCARRLRLSKLTTHHVIPRSEGGQSIVSNLATVCEDHHVQIHSAPEGVAAFRRHWLALQARRANAAQAEGELRGAEGDRGGLRLIEVSP